MCSFQSTPPSEGGDPRSSSSSSRCPRGFNPRRPPRAATLVDAVRPRVDQHVVSIHAALRGRRPLQRGPDADAVHDVSIHAALRGRRPWRRLSWSRRLSLPFQSTPPSEGGDPSSAGPLHRRPTSCFNPRRPPRAATPRNRRRSSLTRGRFQSTPPSEGGDPAAPVVVIRHAVKFQSTPPSEGGDPRDELPAAHQERAVSIHAALRGRRPPSPPSSRPARSTFQSTPPSEGGDPRWCRARRCGRSSFNPRRPPRAATRASARRSAGRTTLGFNPRRPPRAATRVERRSHGRPERRVSIHAALRGRRPRRLLRGLHGGVPGFNPRRPPRAATPAGASPRPPRWARRFNPRRPPRAATQPRRSSPIASRRCFNPRRPPRAATQHRNGDSRRPLRRFNPRRPPRAATRPRPLALLGARRRFNPRRPPRAATRRPRGPPARPRSRRFNPRRPPRAATPVPPSRRCSMRHSFNPRRPPRAATQPASDGAGCASPCFNPRRPPRAATPRRRRCRRTAARSFNPRRPPRAATLAILMNGNDVGRLFQSTPPSEGGDPSPASRR